MKLEINVPVSGLDLATLLEGERGLFLSQNRGQNYITVAKPGHPIAFGPNANRSSDSEPDPKYGARAVVRHQN